MKNLPKNISFLDYRIDSIDNSFCGYQLVAFQMSRSILMLGTPIPIALIETKHGIVPTSMTYTFVSYSDAIGRKLMVC